MKSRRYQLNKEALAVLQKGHPWIFRNQLSSAVAPFKSGDWLRLYNGQNQIVGFGKYEESGLIGIRIFGRGRLPPDSDEWKARIREALKKRTELRSETNAFRAVHGENDGLPGICIDVYDNTAVLMTYAPSVDALGRYIVAILASSLRLEHVLWHLPKKRTGATHRKTRILRGAPPDTSRFNEGDMIIAAPTGSGQKGGMFLDLRGLRRFVRNGKFRRVLNLFCNTGTLSYAAEISGAGEVVNVDISAASLDFARKHHSLGRSSWIEADVFKWLQTLDESEKFDLIIIDPPSMVANNTQLERAMNQYKKLHTLAKLHLEPGGTVVTCSCSSRIKEQPFRTMATQSLAPLIFDRVIPPESDHPVGFREGAYLNILVFRAP